MSCLGDVLTRSYDGDLTGLSGGSSYVGVVGHLVAVSQGGVVTVMSQVGHLLMTCHAEFTMCVCVFFLQGYTPLHLAAIHSHQHMVLALINTYSMSDSTPFTSTPVLQMFKGTLWVFFRYMIACNHSE